jgi:hypothetical protein
MQRGMMGEGLRVGVSNYITYTLHMLRDIAETLPLVAAEFRNYPDIYQQYPDGKGGLTPTEYLESRDANEVLH